MKKKGIEVMRLTTKEWLNRGWYVSLRLRRLKKAYAVSLSKATSGVSVPSGMPKGNGGRNSQEDININIAELDERIKKETAKLEKINAEITEAIDQVKEPNAEVLRLRFMEYLTFEEIAEAVNYSLRQTFRLYKKGIEVIEKRN